MSRSPQKTVAFRTPVKPADPVDAWVGKRRGAEPVEDAVAATVVPLAPPADPMKRFTIDVTESLHTRIKVQCAARGAKMADVIRELLEREFPAGKGA